MGVSSSGVHQAWLHPGGPSPSLGLLPGTWAASPQGTFWTLRVSGKILLLLDMAHFLNAFLESHSPPFEFEKQELLNISLIYKTVILKGKRSEMFIALSHYFLTDPQTKHKCINGSSLKIKSGGLRPRVPPVTYSTEKEARPERWDHLPKVTQPAAEPGLESSSSRPGA